MTVPTGPTLQVFTARARCLHEVRGCRSWFTNPEPGFDRLGFVAEAQVGPFRGLDAGEAVELGELLAFVSDWLASDPNRLDASLYEFVGVPDYVGPVCTAEELRADVDRFARMLLGYAVTGK
jgi:hypothetical protein